MARQIQQYEVTPHGEVCPSDNGKWCLWEDVAPILVEENDSSPNSTMDAIAALADRWCDLTNQPDSICVALYQFTQWARQQHQ